MAYIVSGVTIKHNLLSIVYMKITMVSTTNSFLPSNIAVSSMSFQMVFTVTCRSNRRLISTTVLLPRNKTHSLEGFHYRYLLFYVISWLTQRSQQYEVYRDTGTSRYYNHEYTCREFRTVKARNLFTALCQVVQCFAPKLRTFSLTTIFRPNGLVSYLVRIIYVSKLVFGFTKNNNGVNVSTLFGQILSRKGKY